MPVKPHCGMGRVQGCVEEPSQPFSRLCHAMTLGKLLSSVGHKGWSCHLVADAVLRWLVGSVLTVAGWAHDATSQPEHLQRAALDSPGLYVAVLKLMNCGA